MNLLSNLHGFFFSYQYMHKTAMSHLLPVAVVLWPGGNHKALITEGITQTHTPAVPFKMPPMCANLKKS